MGIQEQLADLKADSLRWQQERQRNPQASRAPAGGISSRDSPDFTVRNSNIAADGYRGSVTRRQQWGPAEQQALETPGYPGREALPRAEPQSYGGQPQYPGNPGLMQPSRGYPGVPDSYNQMGSMESQPAYSFDNRTNQRVTVPYEVDSQAARDPRYPSASGYTVPALGRGNPQPSGYPGYPSNPEYPGVTSPSVPGIRQAPVGRGYDAYGTQQPPDPGYGRSTYTK